MALKTAAQRIEETDDGKIVLFPVRAAGKLRNAPAIAATAGPAIAIAPAIELSERPTIAVSAIQRRVQIALAASLALHVGLFAALAWRFSDDLERAAGASSAASSEGTIVIPIEVVVEAALPSAPSPTNATAPTARPVPAEPKPVIEEQARVPEPEMPPLLDPAPVVLDIPAEAPTPALPVEANAKSQNVEPKETPQAPTRLAVEPRKEAVKQQQKRKQASATPSEAATPNRAAASGGVGQAGAGGQAQAGGAAAISSYQALVLAHLQRYRLYPPEARDRSITGVAAVRFALAANGAVISSGLARSSGQGVLDNAAVDMVRRASPFPPFPPGMGRSRLDFAAPIRFDLR